MARGAAQAIPGAVFAVVGAAGPSLDQHIYTKPRRRSGENGVVWRTRAGASPENPGRQQPIASIYAVETHGCRHKPAASLRALVIHEFESIYLSDWGAPVGSGPTHSPFRSPLSRAFAGAPPSGLARRVSFASIFTRQCTRRPRVTSPPALPLRLRKSGAIPQMFKTVALS